MKTVTTASDFRLFKLEAMKWRDRFGLTDWRIFFHHEDDDGSDAAFAWMQCDYGARSANIGLSRDWVGNEVTDDGVRRVAFHEIMHLLLADLVILGQERWSVEGVYSSAEHSVIRRLEEFFYGKGEGGVKK